MCVHHYIGQSSFYITLLQVHIQNGTYVLISFLLFTVKIIFKVNILEKS